jgi:hypothetical protein
MYLLPLYFVYLSNPSKYTHLVTALYRKHGTSFLTGALYTDSQAIVKNIIYTVTCLQLLDKTGKIPYYILLDGTDRLEGIFGEARTQDHGQNFDILQFVHKLCIGVEINAILERNPKLYRGHKHLNLLNAHIWLGRVKRSPF